MGVGNRADHRKLDMGSSLHLSGGSAEVMQNILSSLIKHEITSGREYLELNMNYACALVCRL